MDKISSGTTFGEDNTKSLMTPFLEAEEANLSKVLHEQNFHLSNSEHGCPISIFEAEFACTVGMDKRQHSLNAVTMSKKCLIEHFLSDYQSHLVHFQCQRRFVPSHCELGEKIVLEQSCFVVQQHCVGHDLKNMSKKKAAALIMITVVQRRYFSLSVSLED